MFRLHRVVVLTSLLAAELPAEQPGFKMQVVGGTVGSLHSGCSARLDLSEAESLVLHCGKTEMTIPWGKVNTLEYGQNVSRRYAVAILISPVLLLSKSRKHFVTLGYVDTEGKQQALVVRVEKGDIRSVLVGLEARTGRRVEYQDSEARKAGKG